MRNFLISFFVRVGEKTYPRWYRLSSLFGTITLIFFLLPLLFIYTGEYIERYINLHMPTFLINVIVSISLMLGVALLVWTLLLQYSYGQGSGSHMVPTQKLIVTGPYKICRHPMQLGAVFFYLGLVTALSSITIGVYSALVTGLLGFFFNVFIEEPVLIIRFGKQYEQYQKDVPLVPFLFSGFNNSNWKHKPRN
ncbi:methyltransferase family protein [Candidatus Dependentiae bacterium]